MKLARHGGSGSKLSRNCSFGSSPVLHSFGPDVAYPDDRAHASARQEGKDPRMFPDSLGLSCIQDKFNCIPNFYRSPVLRVRGILQPDPEISSTSTIRIDRRPTWPVMLLTCCSAAGAS